MTTEWIILGAMLVALWYFFVWKGPKLERARRPQQSLHDKAPEPWVVRHFGDGEISYHSFGGPVVDPRNAHLKTPEVAKAVAEMGDGSFPFDGIHAEALPQSQAIAEYKSRTGRHAT